MTEHNPTKNRRGLITIAFEYEERGQAETFDEAIFVMAKAATCVKVIDYQSGISEEVNGRRVVPRNVRRFGRWAGRLLS